MRPDSVLQNNLILLLAASFFNANFASFLSFRLQLEWEASAKISKHESRNDQQPDDDESNNRNNDGPVFERIDCAPSTRFEGVGRGVGRIGAGPSIHSQVLGLIAGTNAESCRRHDAFLHSVHGHVSLSLLATCDRSLAPPCGV
jgi:hypothetical protein